MVIYNKEDEPLPPDHPFAPGRIIFGKPRPEAEGSPPAASLTHEPSPAERHPAEDEGYELGLWHMSMDPGSSPVIRDQKGNLIATIHAQSLKSQLARAGLIMSAPALLDALLGALDVLHGLAERPTDEMSLAAQDMIPTLESALAAANMLGTIDEADLIGA
jgi:hypothetical protein